MDVSSLVRKSDCEWWIPQAGAMRVPGVIYASEALVRDMDEKVREQIRNVATPIVASTLTRSFGMRTLVSIAIRRSGGRSSGRRQRCRAPSERAS
jgi:hypothetical protein